MPNWDVWSHLPMEVNTRVFTLPVRKNIVDVLNSDLGRVLGIDLYEIPSPVFERITAAMQRPLPELARLHLQPDGDEYDLFPTPSRLDLPHVSITLVGEYHYFILNTPETTFIC